MVIIVFGVDIKEDISRFCAHGQAILPNEAQDFGILSLYSSKRGDESDGFSIR
jgi:hypothetical protein